MEKTIDHSLNKVRVNTVANVAIYPTIETPMRNLDEPSAGYYHYESNDHLRNNRPSRPKVTSVYITTKNNKSENSGNSPVHFIKVPRMPSTLDDFEVISVIGTGAYGTCKKIRRKKDGRVMVWKEMEYGTMTEPEKQMLVSEVNLLRELRHQYIVRYHDRIIDRSRAIIYIIMEYCQGGDLSTIVAQNRRDGTHVSEDFAWKILIQTTLALKECHQRKNGKAVLHRDLKPANVFLDAENNVKLGDFGLARVLHHESSFAQTFVGTPYYMSPELVNNQSYNEKSDIWALGCMLYELCALVPPFIGSNQSELNRKIRIGDYPRLPCQYSMELDMLIRKMIQVEVSKRLSIDLILADPIVQRKLDSLDHKHVARHKRHDLVINNRVNGSGDQADVKYEDLLAKMRQLELKEKELESRERSIALREKLAEEKLKRATDLMDKHRRSDIAACNFTPKVGTYSPCAEEDSLDPPQSCLSNGLKDPDTLKKQVTFHDYLNGKENLRQNSGYKGFTFNTYTGVYSTEGVHEQFKHEDIKNRLFKAKERTKTLKKRVKCNASDSTKISLGQGTKKTAYAVPTRGERTKSDNSFVPDEGLVAST